MSRLELPEGCVTVIFVSQRAEEDPDYGRMAERSRLGRPPGASPGSAAGSGALVSLARHAYRAGARDTLMSGAVARSQCHSTRVAPSVGMMRIQPT